MKKKTIHLPPRRISDLATLKQDGAEVTCQPSFEVLPVDFAHRDQEFQAYIFLCRYEGKVNDSEYTFRKCYSRGCPNNLCPHVSQAVMIANRYLQRDLRTLQNAGIAVENKLFSLDDMVVKFEKLHENQGPPLAIDDYINLAEEGNEVTVEIELEFVPAVEHFANYTEAQTFLMCDFTVTTLGNTHICQRCFACFQTDKTNGERQEAVAVANARLALLYKRFDKVAIKYQKRLFT